MIFDPVQYIADALCILRKDCENHPDTCRNSEIQMTIIKKIFEDNIKTMRHQNDKCKIMDLPDVETIIERCNQGQRWDEDLPPFEGFILEENLDGGWRKDLRNKRFVVTGSLVLSALVGLLISGQ